MQIEDRPKASASVRAIVKHEIVVASRKICRDQVEFERMVAAGVSPQRIGRPVSISIVTRAEDPCEAFRPRAVLILKNPERWLVHDICIGNRSQWPRDKMGRDKFSRPILGASLGQITRLMSLETSQIAMDMVLTVEYVGPEDDGEVCEVSWLGLGSLPTATRAADGSINIED